MRTGTNAGAPHPSLRRLFLLAVSSLACLVALAVGMLVLTTTLMHQATESLVSAAAGGNVARDLQTDLLRHYRLTNLLAATEEVGLRQRQVALERQVFHHLREAQVYVSGPQEGEALVRLSEDVERYFAASHQAAPEALWQSEPVQAAVRAVLDHAGVLQSISQEDLAAATRRVSALDRMANYTGLGVGLVVTVALLGLLAAGRKLVYRPLQELNGAIRRFAAGDQAVRATEQGPAELKEMGRAFNDMAAALVRQREERLSFLGGIAHDLRTPISVLRVSTDPAWLDRAVWSEDRMRQTLARVSRQAERLHRMVDDLLDAVQVEAGQLELKLAEHDLSQMVREAVELFEDVSDKHVLIAEGVDAPRPLRCDRVRVEQVLYNLLSNALKYSPEGGRVFVRVGTEGELLSLTVSDEGVGIGREDLDRIFRPFRRGKVSQEAIPGVGLGLFVTQRIVEAHGGRVKVSSEPGRGSTFQVLLPWRPPRREPLEPARAEASSPEAPWGS